MTINLTAEWLYIIPFFIWWTGFIAFIQLYVTNHSSGFTTCLSAAALWPIILIISPIPVIYKLFVASKAQILCDLKNKKLLKDFYRWTKQKKKWNNTEDRKAIDEITEGLKEIYHLLTYCPDKEKVAAQIAKDLIDDYEKDADQ